MKVRQSHFVPPVPYLVADELGLFARFGVEVESQRTHSSREQYEGLASGDIDVAITAMDNVFSWNSRGIRVGVAGQVERSTPLSLFATPAHAVLADLDGCRFAVDDLTSGFSVLVRALFKDAGLSATLVERGGVTERLEALLDGRADATLLGPPLDHRAEGAGLVALASINDAFPDLPGQGVVIRVPAGGEQSRAITAYLDALAKAISVSATWGEDEGVALLQHAGIPASAAVKLWQARATTLEVSAPGLALLERLRSDLGLLPTGSTHLPNILATP